MFLFYYSEFTLQKSSRGILKPNVDIKLNHFLSERLEDNLDFTALNKSIMFCFNKPLLFAFYHFKIIIYLTFISLPNYEFLLFALRIQNKGDHL